MAGYSWNSHHSDTTAYCDESQGTSLSGSERRYPIPVFKVAGHAYVWDSNDARILREDHAIIGSMVGTLPAQRQQNGVKGLPLILSAEEVALALSKPGLICLLSGENSECCSLDTCLETDSDRVQLCTGGGMRLTAHPWLPPDTVHDRLKEKVMIDLHSKGYAVTTGIKFGVDFLAYPGDPREFHSHFMVLVVGKEAVTPYKILSGARVALSSRKRLVLASVVDNMTDNFSMDGTVVYSTVESDLQFVPLEYRTQRPHLQ